MNSVQYPRLSGRDASAKQAQLWSTVVDYRFAAATKLAADDMRERALADSAIAHVQRHNGFAAWATRNVYAMCCYAGVVLVGLGQRLLGSSLPAADAPSLPAEAPN